MALFARVVSELLDLVAPRDCPACGGETVRSLCSGCRAALQPAPARELAGAPVIAAGCYRPPLDEAIRRFKYESRPDYAAQLAALIRAEALAGTCRDPLTLFVPVPLHRARLAERGYDQAALLARAFARASGRDVSARALRRIRSTEQQARLDERARRCNVVGAFEANPRAGLAGRPVVLVDDVITTGATVLECVRALDAAGARLVAVVCVALAAR